MPISHGSRKSQAATSRSICRRKRLTMTRVTSHRSQLQRTSSTAESRRSAQKLMSRSRNENCWTTIWSKGKIWNISIWWRWHRYRHCSLLTSSSRKMPQSRGSWWQPRWLMGRRRLEMKGQPTSHRMLTTTTQHSLRNHSQERAIYRNLGQWLVSDLRRRRRSPKYSRTAHQPWSEGLRTKIIYTP